ncbi:MAG TPA: hypothetical protein VF540_12095, partial [Segetibacter sp.]
MKKYLSVLLVIFLNMSHFSHAQVQEGYSKKIDSLQIDYITKELVLTTAESQKFWPIYTNYKNEIKTVRKEIERDPIALEEKILNIRKKYKHDFKQILEGEERVNKVYVLEKSFIEMLRNELLERQSKGEGSKGEDTTAKQEDTTAKHQDSTKREGTTKEDTTKWGNTTNDTI